MSQLQHSPSEFEKNLSTKGTKKRGAGLPALFRCFLGTLGGSTISILIALSACLPIPPESPPSPFPTVTASSTSTATPVPSSTATPSTTPIPEIETNLIGYSVQGRPITVTRIGTGDHILVIIGAIHGFEGNTTRLVEALRQGLNGQIPPGERVYFIPAINPDGYANGTRLNANGVDLNRNWDTSNWTRDTCYGEGNPVKGGGGSQPFSEPETAAFSAWLLDLKNKGSSPMRVISYHAYHESGMVLPGFLTTEQGYITYAPAVVFGMQFASGIGYAYSETWPYCPMTGELSNWCADHGIACLLVELHTDLDLTTEEIALQQAAILGILPK